MGLVKRKTEGDPSKTQAKSTNVSNNKNIQENKSNSKKNGKKSFYEQAIQYELKCIFHKIKKLLPAVKYNSTNSRYKILLNNQTIFDVNIKDKTIYKIDDIFISTYLNSLGITKENNFINIAITYNDRSSIIKIPDISSISVMEYKNVFVLEINTNSSTFLVNLEKTCDLKSIVVHRVMLPYIYEFITQQTSFSDSFDGFFEIPQDI